MARLESFHRSLIAEGPKSIAQKLAFALLVPASLLYGMLNWLRSKGYELGLLSRYRATVPVISVGNLAVGGTGKTPVVDWLLKQLQQQGLRPAVVSRGYGGRFSGPVGLVSIGDGPRLSASEAGDEPYLLACRNQQVPILIAKKRAAGVRNAIEQQGAEVVILDDGFQHQAVARDLDLVLLDAKRPFGNGFPLPAGNLREFPRALERAAILLLTRAEQQSTTTEFSAPVWSSQHQIAAHAVGLDGTHVPFTDLANKKIFAFAGIANPNDFIDALKDSGLTVGGSLAFADHAQYDSSSIDEINNAAAGCDLLLTTEKDAVKLSTEMFTLPCYQVPMDIVVWNETELIEEINRRIGR